MNKGRLEAFSDGVLAIIITIMVLALKTPETTTLKALVPSIPVFVSYVLSFIYVGIYWINHHHIIQVTKKINGVILWANLHLLFWLSLIPFATSWVGENHIDAIPVAFYGGVLLLCAIAFKILEASLIKYNGNDFLLKEVIRGARKEKLSIVVYLLAIFLAFASVYISIACYFFVASIWVIPYKKLEKDVEK